MKLTIIGCGDAWGTGGRGHTCFRLDVAGKCVVVDFGASATVGWHRFGLDLGEIDAIVISHLHGDHFGGLPFFLLECQFELRRARPLVIAGPPGLRDRLERAIDVFYPDVVTRGWRFPLDLVEVEPGREIDLLGLRLRTIEVDHASGAPSTAVRIAGGGRIFAYSGDTAWTPKLADLANGADFMIVECYSGERVVPGHVDWPTLKENLPSLKAKKIAVTHMGETSLPRAAEFAAAGVAVLDDGLVFDI